MSGHYMRQYREHGEGIELSGRNEMDCKEKDYRSFYQSSEAYYYKNNALTFPSGTVDEIYFGLSCGGGGTHGEMSMKFIELGGRTVPRLEVFDDGWETLNSFTDLLAEMAGVTDENITPKEFCTILVRCGFEDKTPRDNPYDAKTRSHTPTRQEFQEALRAIATLPSHFGNDDATAIARKALGVEKP